MTLQQIRGSLLNIERLQLFDIFYYILDKVYFKGVLVYFLLKDGMFVQVICNYLIWFVFNFIFLIMFSFILIQETMGKSEDNRYYIVRGYWNPLSRAFKHLNYLNEETPKGKKNQFHIILIIFIRNEILNTTQCFEITI